MSRQGGGGANLRETRDRSAYFGHDADIGVIGRGPTLEEAFVAAAEATFAVMGDPDDVRPVKRIHVAFEESDPELALVMWLNSLLAEAHAAGLALGRFSLQRAGNRWRGEASGEPWRPDLVRGVEVKGATLSMLAVRQSGGTWEARCVVDV
jgi:SHS2 domain-containing protein